MRVKKTIRLLIIFLLGLYIALVLYIQTQAYVDTARPSDAIIVLGTRPSVETPNPCLVARVRHATELYTRGVARKLVFSGGKLHRDEKSEAEVMKDVALSLGVADSAILLEPDSTSTYENLSFSQKILEHEHLSLVIIISDPYHLPRAALIAKKLGLSYSISPATDSPCSSELHNIIMYFTSEPLKIVWYKLNGKL